MNNVSRQIQQTFLFIIKEVQFTLNIKAQIMIKLNNEIEAIQTYDQFIQVDPTLYEPYYHKDKSAQILLNQRDFNQYLLSYDALIKINPSCYQAYQNKGIQDQILSAEILNKQLAIECYNQFIQSNPTHDKVGEFQELIIKTQNREYD
ncbi:hypothetical protein pb186bvf_020680 [Paramecium bursaria]